MSSRGEASRSRTPRRPSLASLPAKDVQEFRVELKKFLESTDAQGRKIGSSVWGVYAFYDYDGEPIYVGQTKEQLQVRVRRHLTNQRTDAVAMRVLDPIEVASVEIWPLWDLEGIPRAEAQSRLDACEYTAYVHAIQNSKFKAILNEKIPPLSDMVELPRSYKKELISDLHRIERGHPDIRIGRRAETLSRLAAVARERGEVNVGLRRVIVIQAVRLAYLSAERLAYAEGREKPGADAIDMDKLIGSVYAEPDQEQTEEPEFVPEEP